MKENESEWISVSDCMASIVVILIIFVIAGVLRNESSTTSENLQRARIQQILTDFFKKANIVNNGRNSIGLDTAKLAIIFEDGAFQRSRPCLDNNMKLNLISFKEDFRDILSGNPGSIIMIEGFTDTTDFPPDSHSGCNCHPDSYLFNDNVSLSIDRAAEARLTLIRGWPVTFAERVTISGYGATMADPALGDNNRRVTFSIGLK